MKEKREILASSHRVIYTRLYGSSALFRIFYYELDDSSINFYSLEWNLLTSPPIIGFNIVMNGVNFSN